MKKQLVLIGVLLISISGLTFAQSATILPNSSDFSNNGSDDFSYAVRGILSGLTPGLYAAAIRGENKGTNAKGIGVWGSHEGSGWGVFGSSESGTGVVGRAISGVGLNGISLNGTALTAESGTATAAAFSTTNEENTNQTVKINTNGKGIGLDMSLTNPTNGSKALNIVHSGTGNGINVETNAISIRCITTSMFGAALLGDNQSGTAILGRSQGDAGAAGVAGRGENSAAGVKGFNTDNGIGVLGLGGVENSLSVAGRFENQYSSNTSNALEAVTNGTGAAAYIRNTNSNGNGAGLIVGKAKPYAQLFTTSVGADLEVRHAMESTMGMSGLRIVNTGPNLSNWTLYAVNNNGDLILYANGATKGTFNSNTGAYTAVSDKRLKTNISNYRSSLADVMKMEVKSYQRLNSNKTEVGLMAQEAIKYFPEIVYDNTNDKGEQFYTMDYSRIGVIAIKAIQEQQKLIDKQQQVITDLQKQLQKHEEAINTLSNSLILLEKNNRLR